MLYNRKTSKTEGNIYKTRSESMNRITFKLKNIRYRRANARQNNAASAA
jgi:hypothetical protein